MTVDAALRALIREAVREELATLRADIKSLLPKPTPKLCTIKEAADELRMCETTVRRLIRQGRLRGGKAASGGSSRLLVSREALNEYRRQMEQTR